MKNRLLVYLNDDDASAAQYAKSIAREATELEAAIRRGESERAIAHRTSCFCDAIWALLGKECIGDDGRRRLDVLLSTALWSNIDDLQVLPAMARDALIGVEACPHIQRRSRGPHGVESQP